MSTRLVFGLLLGTFIIVLFSEKNKELRRFGVKAAVIKAEYHSEGYSPIKYEPLYLYHLDTDSNGSIDASVIAFTGTVVIPPDLNKIGKLNQKAMFDMETFDGKTWQVTHVNL